MAVSARKHIVPAAGETPRRAVINDLAASINDIVPVANATARAQLVADVVNVGHAWPRPLYVDRADAHPARRLEVTIDGATWVPVGVQHAWMGVIATDVAIAHGAVITGAGINTSVVGGKLPYATRMHVQLAGTAGFHSAAVSVAVEIRRSGSGFAPVTQVIPQAVPAPAAGYAPIAHMGYVDLPANAEWDGSCMAVTSGAAAYYRLGLHVTRVPA